MSGDPFYSVRADPEVMVAFSRVSDAYTDLGHAIAHEIVVLWHDMLPVAHRSVAQHDRMVESAARLDVRRRKVWEAEQALRDATDAARQKLVNNPALMEGRA